MRGFTRPLAGLFGGHTALAERSRDHVDGRDAGDLREELRGVADLAGPESEHLALGTCRA